MTNSKPDEVVAVVADIASNELDPSGQAVVIGMRRFSAPLSFDYVTPSDFKRISMIPWFDKAPFLVNAE